MSQKPEGSGLAAPPANEEDSTRGRAWSEAQRVAIEAPGALNASKLLLSVAELKAELERLRTENVRIVAEAKQAHETNNELVRERFALRRETIERCAQVADSNADLYAQYGDAYSAARSEQSEIIAEEIRRLATPGACEGARTDGLLQCPRCPRLLANQSEVDSHLCLDPGAATPPVEAPRLFCVECGIILNEGEAKCFTVCDSCWSEGTGRPKSERATPPTEVKPAEFCVHGLDVDVSCGQCVAHGWEAKPATEGKPRQGLQALLGKWPGDETAEELLGALAEGKGPEPRHDWRRIAEEQQRRALKAENAHVDERARSAALANGCGKHRQDELEFAGCAACAWRKYHEANDKAAALEARIEEEHADHLECDSKSCRQIGDLQQKTAALERERDDLKSQLTEALRDDDNDAKRWRIYWKKRCTAAEARSAALSTELTETRTQADASIRAAQDAEQAAVARAEVIERDRASLVAQLEAPCPHHARAEAAESRSTALLEALSVARNTLTDMAGAFSWGSTFSVAAGVGRCKVALADVERALGADK